MAKKIIFILLIVFSCQKLISQKILSEIQANKGSQIRRVDCYGVDGYAFLGYEELNPSTTVWRFSSYIILPGGSLIKFIDDKDVFNSIVGFVPVSANIYRMYYASGSDRKLILNSLEINLSSGEKVYSQKPYELKRRLLGSKIEGKYLLLYALDNDKGTELTVIKMENLDSFTESHFSLPMNLGNFKESEIAMITSSDFVSIGQSLEKIRIIASSKESIDIIQDNYWESLKDKVSGTFMVHVDFVKNSVETKLIDEPLRANASMVKYSSYVIDNYLFRVVLQRDLFTLRVFDWKNGDLIYNKDEPKSTASSNTVYHRTRKNGVSSTSFAGLLEKPSAITPFILVYKDSTNDNYRALVGTSMNQKGIASPLGVNPASLVAAAIVTTIKQLSPAPEVANYYYYYGNTKNGFAFATEDPTKGVMQKIDSFESTKIPAKNTPRYEGLTYSYINKGLLGVYLDEIDRSLKVIAFQ